MGSIDPTGVQGWAALVAGACAIATAFVLAGFRRGRLRWFHVSFCVAAALVGLRLHVTRELDAAGGWWAAVVWLNFAAHWVWALVGSLVIAGKPGADER